MNDGSTDTTQRVLNAWRKRLPNLRCVSHAKNRGQSACLNDGVDLAKGDYLLFMDDDCIPRHDWVKELGEAVIQGRVVAGVVDTARSDTMKLAANIAEFHPFLPGTRHREVDFLAGANMAVQRSVFREVGGFSSALPSSVDTDFVLKVRSHGYRVWFAPLARVLHDTERTGFSDILKYQAQRARTTIQLRNLYRTVLKTPIILRNVVLLLVCAPILALGVTIRMYLKNRLLWKYFWLSPLIYSIKLSWCWGAARGLVSNGPARRRTR